MEKGCRKAQFYLVAAIIIVMIITGLASIKIYADSRPEPKNLEDISSELSLEGAKIIDYGIYNNENLSGLMQSFTDEEFAPYFLEKTQETNIVFLYGNKTSLYSVQYKKDYTGTVSATLGSASVDWKPEDIYTNRTRVVPVGDSVDVFILGKKFSFDIRDNEMFYFLITQENQGEVYVKRN